MGKKLLFFLNPKAGHQELRSSMLDVLDLFTAGGYDVSVRPTQCAGDLTEQIVRRGSEFDMIVCAGGDGTLNEAVSGLMQLEQRPRLGYIPGGTVNDVAATLSLSKKPVVAARDIVAGVPMSMDVGHFANSRWFTYVAGFGAFTDVSYETPQAGKRIFGRLAYFFNGVKTLSKIKAIPVRFEVNGETFEDEVLLGLVCSTTSVGGFHGLKTPNVSLNDGLYEIILAKRIHHVSDLSAIATLLLKREFDPKFFYTFQSDQVRFYFDEPVKWTLDGEFGGNLTDVEIQTHKQAIEIMVPNPQ